MDGPREFDEGSTATLTARVLDPDGDPVSVRWWIDGMPAGTDLTVAVPGRRWGTRTVRLEASDGRGGVAAVLTDVVVRNVAPTIRLTDTPPTVVMGTRFEVGVSVTDPGVDDLRAQYGPLGDPGPWPLTDLRPDQGSAGSGVLVLPTDTPGLRRKVVIACDTAVACSTVRFDYLVVTPEPDNRPPTARLETPVTVDEGTAFDVRALVEDPDADALSLVWRVDGAVVTDTATTLRLGGRRAGIVRVVLTVHDGRHDPVVVGVDVDVRNLPPQVRTTAPPEATAGTGWELVVDGSDAGDGPLTATVDFGDGTVTSAIDVPADGRLRLPHPYRNAGMYRVTVRLCDSSASCVDAALDVLVVTPTTAPPTTAPPTTAPPTTAPPTTAPPTTAPPTTAPPTTAPATVATADTTVPPSGQPTVPLGVGAGTPPGLPTPTSVPVPTGVAPAPGGGRLPRTGGDPGLLVAAAVALVALGLGLRRASVVDRAHRRRSAGGRPR